MTTKKKSPSILLCVNLISPGRRVYDQLYLSNFASLNVKDDLARIKGVGDVAFLGPRDYSMRVWLDPNKLASRGMTAGDVIKAIREQNVQVAAGRLGQPPVPAGANVPFQLTINTQGRLDQRRAVRQDHREDGRRAARTSISRTSCAKRARRDGSSSERASNWAPRTTTSTATSTASRP